MPNPDPAPMPTSAVEPHVSSDAGILDAASPPAGEDVSAGSAGRWLEARGAEEELAAAERAGFPPRWEPTMRANLVFLVNGGEVLLIHKKTGLGAGKINGPGGKLESGESALEAALREVEEELRIRARNLDEVGELHFDFVDGLRLHCAVFLGSEFEGVPVETSEAKPEWFAIEDIPYDRMWADDRHWLPQMLAGRRFRAWFRFDGEDMLTRELVFY